jgi:glutamyl-tRNA synthetase
MTDVRVRFAPSPTGFLHVGGLRTVLYNYLFAKQKNGKFILRIEDTDQTRLVDGAVDNLIDTLNRCGLEYDEGPKKDGGFGPYVQSERTEIYRKYAKQLVDEDKAYPCFCTSERLDELRNLQKLRKEAPGYDGRCRHLPKEEVEKRITDGESYTIRMKIPKDLKVKFQDAVRGWVTFEGANIDDQVLMKSDNFPTYHLANVVDDYLMGITHNIRGEEWLPSTPKHILLYEMFGWEQPTFAHLPLLLNMDRTKLSKRQNDVAVEDYLDKGYVLEAVLNFVALLGWNEGDGSEQEIFSLEELTEKFTLEKVNKAGAVFDVAKLRWMNGVYIRKMDENEFYKFVKPFLEKAGVSIEDEEQMKKIVFSVRDNIEIATDVPEAIKIYMEDFVFESDEAKELAELNDSKTLFAAMVEKFSELDELSKENFKLTMKSVQKETGFKGKGLWMPYRVALTGQMHGPDISTISEIFGKEKILNRLKNRVN